MRTHAERSRPGRSPSLPGGASGTRDPAGPATGAGTAMPEVRTPDDAATLQRTVGNQATVQAIRATPPSAGPAPSATRPIVVQRSLSVSQAETIARRLDDAMSGPGTDEEAIYGALSGRTPTDFQAIKEAYAHLDLGDGDLDADLADDLNEEELAKVRAQLDETREESTLEEGEQAAARVERAAAIARQLDEAMRDLGTEEDQIWNALEGRSPAEISEIKRQYRELTGRHLDRDFMDDLSGDDLKRALRLVGIDAAGDFENYVRQDMTEGQVTAGTGKFEWMLEPEQLRVEVPVHFKPDDGVTVPLADWNGKVDRKWNQFAAVEPGGMKIPLNITMRPDAGADHEVNVHANTNPDPTKWYEDRADAGNWYLRMKDSTVPHEFGHLIGLPDEYQRTGPDFQSIVGATPTGPENTSGRTVEEIADEIHEGLYLEDETQRAPTVTATLQSVGLIVGGAPQQGVFAQGIKVAYDEKYEGWFSKSLVEAMRDKLPKGTKWTIQTVFSFASRSIMGDPGGLTGTEGHDHAVEPRHMRHFLDIIRRSYPEKEWTVGPK